MFIAQLFGLADTMCALLRVRCLSWRMFGLASFLVGPCGFFGVATYKVYRLVRVQKSLRFNPSPTPSLEKMRTSLMALPWKAKFPQLLLFFIDIRFVGGWGKKGPEASFWGFLMGAYTDSFWAIAAWVLMKKIFASLTKQMFDGAQNAIANVVIYSLDLLLFVWFRPFRDNLVNFAQTLAASSNLMGIIVSALPMLLPENLIPGWIRGPVVMWVTVAGTSILTVAAVFDPIFSVLGIVATVGGKVTSVCNLGGASGIFLANLRATLWVRIQMICIGRTKQKASIAVKKAHADVRNASGAGEQKGIREDEKRNITESEWLDLVRDIHYASKVYKKGRTYHPGYKERYMVLTEGKLVWFKISEMALDEFDHYDVKRSEPQGSLSLYICEVTKFESHGDSYFAQEFGDGMGFEVLGADGKSRRFLVTQESTRDEWVKKIKKTARLHRRQRNRSSSKSTGKGHPHSVNSSGAAQDENIEMPKPARPFSADDDFKDQHPNSTAVWLGGGNGLESIGTATATPDQASSKSAMQGGNMSFMVSSDIGFAKQNQDGGPPNYWNSVGLPAPPQPKTPPLLSLPIVASHISQQPPRLMFEGSYNPDDNGTPYLSPREPTPNFSRMQHPQNPEVKGTGLMTMLHDHASPQRSVALARSPELGITRGVGAGLAASATIGGLAVSANGFHRCIYIELLVFS